MRHREHNLDTPHIRNGVLHLDNEETDIQIDSAKWLDWINTRQPFYFVGKRGTLHARPEKRHGHWYWYAYRRKNGKLNKRYIGKDESVKLMNLERICWKLDRN